ncbi:MAG: extracellular solute-binding protein, partial [Treponema sp.]|nr:extracellular solute-binding protein [Treponema sp.]
MRRTMCFVLALLLCAAAVFARGGQQGTSGPATNSAAIVTAPGQLPLVTEPVTITIGMQQSQNVADYSTNYLTKYLQEKTGLTFKFHFFSSNASDATTQLELMVSSGEKLPDLVVMVNTPNWKEYGDAGHFIDLNPLYEKYGYFYNQRVGKLDPAEQNRIKIKSSSSSGKRYAHSLYSYQVTQNYRSMNFINQTWLNNLGLKMPTTTEEFYNTLVAFRDRDPNKNGRKDEIPFLGSLSAYASEPLAFLINAFVYYPYRDAGNGFLNATDGKLWTPWTTEEYREALRYINRLYKEGLLAASTFTMTQPEMIPLLSYAKGATPTVGFFSGHQNQVLQPETPAIFDYTYQVSLTGPKGVNWYPQLLATVAPTCFITRDAAYPEAVFRLLDFMCDLETTMTNRYGEKDVDWRYVPASENAKSSLGRPAWFEQINMIWGIPQNKHWGTNWAEIF